MFVCLLVMWRTNGNPNTYTDLDEIFHTHLHLSKEGFGAGLTPLFPHLGLGAGPETCWDRIPAPYHFATLTPYILLYLHLSNPRTLALDS